MKIEEQGDVWIVTDGTNFLHKGANGPRLFGKPKKVKDIILYPSYNTAETIAWSWIRDNSAIRIEAVTLSLKSKL